MNNLYEIHWKIPILLPNLSADYENKLKELFNIRGGNKIFNDFGGLEKKNYDFSQTLDPKPSFYNCINKIKSSKISGKKFPYEYTHEEIKNAKINLNIHRYYKNLIILNIKFTFYLDNSKKNLLELQDIETHTFIYDLILNIGGLIYSVNPKAFSQIDTPTVYPCVNILHKLDEKTMVETVTRHKRPPIEIIKAVIEKNSIHQINDKNHVLIDKQGILSVVNDISLIKDSYRKFISVCAIIELSIVFSIILRKKIFNFLKNTDKNFIIDLIKTPDRIIVESVTSEKAWNVLKDSLKLESKLNHFKEEESRELNSFQEAKKRILYFKQMIENNDCYKIFNKKDENTDEEISLLESDLQYAFKFCWINTSFSFDSEINNGRGPVDFKVSNGRDDSTLIEFKLARNSQLKNNLKNQLSIYEKANQTKDSMTVIVYYNDKEFDKVNKILSELNIKDSKNIILIDATVKQSASKVV